LVTGVTHELLVDECNAPLWLQAVGETLLTVRAVDSDGDEVRYRLTGDGNSRTYFQVDPVTGDISAKWDLRQDTKTTYTVCKICRVNIDMRHIGDEMRHVLLEFSCQLDKDRFRPIIKG